MWEFSPGKIETARDARDITQADLAKLISSSTQQVGQWECGEVSPGMDSFIKIVNALKVPPRFFFVCSSND